MFNLIKRKHTCKLDNNDYTYYKAREMLYYYVNFSFKNFFFLRSLIRVLNFLNFLYDFELMDGWDDNNFQLERTNSRDFSNQKQL